MISKSTTHSKVSQAVRYQSTQCSNCNIFMEVFLIIFRLKCSISANALPCTYTLGNKMSFEVRSVLYAKLLLFLEIDMLNILNCDMLLEYYPPLSLGFNKSEHRTIKYKGHL